MRAAIFIGLPLILLMTTIKMSSAQSPGSFMLLAPKKLIPDSVYTIWVGRDANTNNEPPPLRIYMDCQEVGQGSSQNIPIATFSVEQLAIFQTANLTTTGMSSQTYDSCILVAAHAQTQQILDMTQLTLVSPAEKNRSSVKIYIQTDKPAYKPEDTVRVRLIILNENWLPSPQSHVKLSIRDAKNIRVRNSDSKENPYEFGDDAGNGIKKFKYKLASAVNLGIWTITVESGSVQQSITFKVKKNILYFRLGSVPENEFFWAQSAKTCRINFAKKTP